MRSLVPIPSSRPHRSPNVRNQTRDGQQGSHSRQVNALIVAKSVIAKAASHRDDFLSLEQAAAVAEFDDDSYAVKELIVAAQHGYGFDHRPDRTGGANPNSVSCPTTARRPRPNSWSGQVVR
jgi:hypothetical protein